MIRYRIKYARGRYVPQWKGWFFWHDFTLSFEPVRTFNRRADALAFLCRAKAADHPATVEEIDDPCRV